MEQGIVELVKIGAPVTLTSIEVAEMIGKEHKKLLRDIRTYSSYLSEAKLGLGEYFIESLYSDANGQNRPCYEITKKGCEICANKLQGKKGVLFTAKYVDRFNEMQDELIKNLAKPIIMDSYMIDNPIERAERWIEEEKERQTLAASNKEKDELLIKQKPKVDFANAAAGCDNSILVRQLSKILNQAGIICGEKRLFASLRDNGYLIKQQCADYNMPTQKSVDLGLFTVKSTVISNSSSGAVNYTPKVTQRGVQYFTEKYVSGELNI